MGFDLWVQLRLRNLVPSLICMAEGDPFNSCDDPWIKTQHLGVCAGKNLIELFDRSKGVAT